MIAIIPARGGSKRIPRKNIRDFHGQPILARTISEIKKTGLFEKIVVSTEDLEIASIANQSGAEVIFRNLELAGDFSTTVDVIADAIVKIEKDFGISKDIYCCVYPITPNLPRHYLEEAVGLLKSQKLDYVFSAKQFTTSPARSLIVGVDGKSEMQYPEFLNTRTQDLPKSFQDAAMFYLGYRDSWIGKKPVLYGNSKFIQVGKYETIDVDEPEDWDFLEEVYAIRLESKAPQ